MAKTSSAIVATLAVVLLSGCGGPIKGAELRRGVESLQSFATEGAILAEGVVHNRTKNTFVRVRAHEIGERVDHEAEKLNDAQATSRGLPDKQAATHLATDISDAVGDLQTSPADRAMALSTARNLRQLADRAEKLAQRL